MSEHHNTLVRRFEQAFADNDTAVIDELCDANLVDHNPAAGQAPTLAGFKETIAMYRAQFPDAESVIQAVVAEDDQVATRWSITATHDHDAFGVPATGKRVAAEGMNFYRLADGKITDVWTQFDQLGLMQQLGAIPTD